MYIQAHAMSGAVAEKSLVSRFFYSFPGSPVNILCLDPCPHCGHRFLASFIDHSIYFYLFMETSACHKQRSGHIGIIPFRFSAPVNYNKISFSNFLFSWLRMGFGTILTGSHYYIKWYTFTSFSFKLLLQSKGDSPFPGADFYERFDFQEGGFRSFNSTYYSVDFSLILHFSEILYNVWVWLQCDR